MWIPSLEFATTFRANKSLLRDVFRPLVAAQMLLVPVSSVATRQLTPKRVGGGCTSRSLDGLDLAGKTFHWHTA